MSDALAALRANPARAARHYKQHLTALIADCRACIAMVDAEMKAPPSSERGKAVAGVLNKLEMAVDQASHFGLLKPLKRRKTR